jgi:hypothetical protein
VTADFFESCWPGGICGSQRIMSLSRSCSDVNVSFKKHIIIPQALDNSLLVSKVLATCLPDPSQSPHDVLRVASSLRLEKHVGEGELHDVAHDTVSRHPHKSQALFASVMMNVTLVILCLSCPLFHCKQT